MEFLVISAISDSKVNLANELTKLANSFKCNIVESRMQTLGSEFTANMLVVGTWSAIVKMESHLESLEKELNVQIIKQRTKVIPYSKDFLPYIVYVVAKDQIGILHKVTDFFAEQEINITELQAETRPARKFGTMIISLTMFINVPADINISDLRERFIIFCDSYNLDGVMEGEKGI